MDTITVYPAVHHHWANAAHPANLANASRRDRTSAAIGTSSHCRIGDRPIDTMGSTGIHSEYAQLSRMEVFIHSLKAV